MQTHAMDALENSLPTQPTAKMEIQHGLVLIVVILSVDPPMSPVCDLVLRYMQLKQVCGLLINLWDYEIRWVLAWYQPLFPFGAFEDAFDARQPAILTLIFSW